MNKRPARNFSRSFATARTGGRFRERCHGFVGEFLRKWFSDNGLYQGMALAVPPEDPREFGLQPLHMAIPARNADAKEILSPSRTFFATTRTSLGRNLLQSARHATLFIEVLRSYVAAKK